MNDTNPDLRPVPPPGVHGGDGEAIARALGLDPAEILDLSTTLNPLTPDPTPILTRHLGRLARYPDPTRATTALAERLDVEPERILLTNGGSEAIDLVGRLLGGRVEEPDFALYPRGPAPSPVPGLTPDDPPRWRSNPRSPFGHVETVPESPRSGRTVWDEAFWPLATATWSRRDDRRGDIVVGSLTKLLACPGLRMGHLIVPDDAFGERLMAEIVRLRAGWPVGGLVCAALPDLLDTVDLPAWTDGLRSLRDHTTERLRALGFEVTGSGPTWLLVAGSDLRARLARHRIVVRDCASFGLPDTIRLGLPSPSSLPTVLEAFGAVADACRP